MKNLVLSEWLLTIKAPIKRRLGRITVTVTNVGRADQAFASAMARLIEVHLNATVRRHA